MIGVNFRPKISAMLLTKVPYMILLHISMVHYFESTLGVVYQFQ